MSILQKQISSSKHTGFENSLRHYILLGLPLSADFFFIKIHLTPVAETNVLSSLKYFFNLRSAYHRPFLCFNPNKNE